MSFRMARENAGYSQSEVAKILDLDQSAIANWELGRNRPRAALLPRIAGVYCCTIEQLLEGNPGQEIPMA